MNTAAPGSRFHSPTPWSPNLDHSHSSGHVPRILPLHDSRQNAVGNTVGYDRIAQDLRTALRDDDVEMEDASDWPTSWENSDDEQESQSGEELNLAQSSASRLEPPSLPLSKDGETRLLYIALDTNIFISHLKTVQAIHEQLSQDSVRDQKQTASKSSQGRIKLLVPNVVIHGKQHGFPNISYLIIPVLRTELDKQKNLRDMSSSVHPPQAASNGAVARSLHDSQHAKPSTINGSNKTSPHTLAASARSAIEWLLRIRQAQRRGGPDRALAQLCVFQKKSEVMKDDIIVGLSFLFTLSWNQTSKYFVTLLKLSKADDRILDCCEFYQNDIRDFAGTNDVILWTDDKNLSLQVSES